MSSDGRGRNMSEHERKIRKAIEMERHRQLGAALHRGGKSALKKFLAGAAIIGTAVICAGFYDGDQVRVETVYTVQPGDTLWGISETYLQKNTGGRPVIRDCKQSRGV